mgnify:CR=1 FL=1
MKHILKCYLPICILLLSCDSRDNVKRQYEQLTSDTISLCLNQMMAVSYDGDDILQVKTNCMSNCVKKNGRVCRYIFMYYMLYENIAPMVPFDRYNGTIGAMPWV